MNNTLQKEKIDELSLTIIELLSKTPFKVFTIDEIKNKLIKSKIKTNYATVYRKIDSLVNQSIFLKEKYGMASKIQINCLNERVVSLLSLIEIKKFEKFFGKLKGNILTSIKEIVSDVKGIGDFKYILIFGSYAKWTQHKNSDLDLLVVYEISKRLLNLLSEEQYDNYVKDIKTSITQIIKTSELRGGPNINPIIVSDDEHKEMIINNEENIAKETLLNHVILKGHNEYWLDVLKSK
ncbi:MAG: nucleotidyltransferase domain-containing protein [Nanoarchaeota archaeon]|nr:nucleotidyltransferase domain-containing protein [Nanoarchaeota archaeon]MBU1632240.1 nucleotidyltransferase domain-containing protein [Nanoarchaeota archaeon]MBU1875762.1 nucleotidyltransferase domain-containing protein [Nanoarchaeota archaeon]